MDKWGSGSKKIAFAHGYFAVEAGTFTIERFLRVILSYPALVPSGTGFSGCASTGVILSA